VRKRWEIPKPESVKSAMLYMVRIIFFPELHPSLVSLWMILFVSLQRILYVSLEVRHFKGMQMHDMVLPSQQGLVSAQV
jgi:hypothetical protein